MDTPTTEKNIQYTSFRYWRIVVPLFALAIIAEYVLLFFFYPASTNTARVITNLNLTKSVNSAIANAAKVTAATAAKAANASVQVVASALGNPLNKKTTP